MFWIFRLKKSLQKCFEYADLNNLYFRIVAKCCSESVFTNILVFQCGPSSNICFQSNDYLSWQIHPAFPNKMIHLQILCLGVILNQNIKCESFSDNTGSKKRRVKQIQSMPNFWNIKNNIYWNSYNSTRKLWIVLYQYKKEIT